MCDVDSNAILSDASLLPLTPYTTVSAINNAKASVETVIQYCWQYLDGKYI